MTKALALLGLLFTSLDQPPGTTEVVIPTEIVVSPNPFGRTQQLTVKSSFQQPRVLCPPLKDRSDGLVLRIYDEKKVPTEPVWTLSEETTSLVQVPATVAPIDGDDGKRIEREFESFDLPASAPARIYAVVWRVCSWQILVAPGDPPIYKPGLSTAMRGGKFFKYSCGNSKSRIPTEQCAYRPE